MLFAVPGLLFAVPGLIYDSRCGVKAPGFSVQSVGMIRV